MRAPLVEQRPRQLATAAAVLLILGSVASARLLHVGLVFRHGHRSPIHLLPNDSHTVANTWRDGLGQLTNLGKRNHFELGAFLRRRYGEFLGTRYNNSEHHIRSSDFDRTLMSAQACLAGLFPPVDDQAWQSGLAWQPIPVHTVARDQDPLLQPTKFAACSSRFAELAGVAGRSPERRRVVAESADFLRRLSAAAGGWPFTFDNLYQVTDTLMVLRAANLTLPAWATAGDTYQRLQRLGSFGWRQFSWSPELRQLQIGVLLDDLLTRLEAVAAGRLPSNGGRRLTVYSGHDVTLTPLLAALGNEDFVWPNYAACVLFELHAPPPGTGPDGQPLVRIFYRNDTRRPEPLPIRVPGCDPGGCPLGRLAGLLAACRISDASFRELCGGGRPETPLGRRNVVVVAASAALGGAAVALLAAMLAYFACLRRRLQGGQDRPSVAYHSLLGAVEN